LGIKIGYQIRPTPAVGCRPDRLKLQLRPLSAAGADPVDSFQRICKLGDYGFDPDEVHSPAGSTSHVGNSPSPGGPWSRQLPRLRCGASLRPSGPVGADRTPTASASAARTAELATALPKDTGQLGMELGMRCRLLPPTPADGAERNSSSGRVGLLEPALPTP
jgi:hypothetical protein